MSQTTSVRLAAMPNAGLPKYMDKRFVYPSTPEYFAEYTRKLVEAGANIVGGCCGTSPEHTARMREALAGEWNRRGRSQVAGPRSQVDVVPADSPGEREMGEQAAPRTLREKLAAGEFVV